MNHLLSILAMFFLLKKVYCAVLIADWKMEKMIELQGQKPYCNIYTDRNDIQRMLLSADTKRTRQVTREVVERLESVCVEAVDTTDSIIHGGFYFIYPGTKWCGPGNISTSFNDLGSRYIEEDKCCREHDYCTYTLSPGECNRGLCNNLGTITRSHCDCDQRLRRCLQNVKTETGNTLGAMFFNVVQVTCFRERRCTIYQTQNDFCGYEFITAEPFTLPRNINRNKLSAMFDSKIDGRSLIDNSIAPTNQIESVRLVATSLFKEAILRPVNEFFKFANVLSKIFVTNKEQNDMLAGL